MGRSGKAHFHRAGLLLDTVIDSEGLCGDGLGNGEERAGGTAAQTEAATKATSGFDTGGWLTSVVFFEVIVKGNAASAWNASATGSRVPVGIGNVPLDLQEGLTFR